MDASSENSLDDQIASAIELLSAFVVPLYVDLGGRPVLQGTGFFVNADSDCFLVSAAHVLEKAIEHPMYYYSMPSQKRHLDGRLVRSRSTLVDVGAVRLGSTGRPPYRELQKYPMDISYLKPRRTPRSGRHYAIIGFPETKNRFRVKQRDVLAVPYAYHTESLPDSDYTTHGVAPESHILLPLDLRRGFDAGKRPVHFPRPQGMSGAPMIVLFEDSQDSRVFPVVGVGIEYRKRDRILVATDAQSILEAMRRAA